MIAFKYCDEKGFINQNSNPNGSVNNIAGIFNKNKNILGMMPHPERMIEKSVSGDDGISLLSSLLNLPTINVPIGFNKDGLPLGMQIIGKKYEDLKILTFAKRYEQIFVHSKSKPKLN